MPVVGTDLEAAARQWQDEGWALVEGLVPEADIDAVAEDVARLYATDTFDNYNQAKGFGDGSPDGKQFRSTQFDGMRGFPFRDCPTLNNLFVHPRLVAFAQIALPGRRHPHLSSGGVGQVGGCDQLRAATAPGRQPLAAPAAHGARLLAPGVVPVPLRRGRGLRAAAPRAPQQVVGRLRRAVCARSRRHRQARLPAHLSLRCVAPRERLRPRPTHPASYSSPPSAPRAPTGSGTTRSRVWATAACGPSSWRARHPTTWHCSAYRRPGHAYWNAATVDAMADRHPGLDMSPWRDALGKSPG